MKHAMLLRIAAGLILNSLLLAKSGPPSLVQSQDTNGLQGYTGPIIKVCSEKNPPPCATPPRPISSPPAEYSEQARRAKYQGTCILRLVVETDGRPSHIRVMSTLGMGLDEKAIAAVKTWKFKPASVDGKPVAVEIAVAVDFHLKN